MSSLLNMSGGSLLKKGLPYDAEIEYLRGTGTQYIDSGIECTGDLSVNFKVRWSTDVNMALNGSIYNYGPNFFRHHLSPTLSYSQNNFYWLQYDRDSYSSITYLSKLNTWYTVIIDASNGTYNINGTTGKFTPVSGNITAHANYSIFGRLSGNLATQIRSGDNDFAYIQLSRNGILLRDFIPVRVGTTGYLYDKVSGQLFGNQGTGDFILGADKQ